MSVLVRHLNRLGAGLKTMLHSFLVAILRSLAYSSLVNGFDMAFEVISPTRTVSTIGACQERAARPIVCLLMSREVSLGRKAKRWLPLATTHV